MVEKSIPVATKTTSPKSKNSSSFPSRPPIVTFMGHVDHGKTSLLDRIRKTQVQSKEVGGITQSIGAYQADFQGTKITFIDTPGHEAFTTMRARGGQAADLVVLVVAGDDGVMPQTIEAIDHAKAAEVPILVAINKIDLPGVNVEKVKSQLAQNGILVENRGGEVVVVEVSAKTGQRIEELLEMIVLVSSMQELKAAVNTLARGQVLESKRDERKGVLTTLLVKEGVLRVGDVLVAGDSYGKVKAMFDWQGRPLPKANPSEPVEILGLKGVAKAGETFGVVRSEKEAQSVLEREEGNKVRTPVHLESQKNDEGRELLFIIKADTQGSLEAVHHSVEKLQSERRMIRYLHEGIGPITEADVMLAATAQAVILGFRVGVEKTAQAAAEFEHVFYKTYEVIYHLLEEVEDVVLREEEERRIKVLGRARLVKIFELSDKTRIAGSKVSEGVLRKGNKVQLTRGEKTVSETVISSLKRGKEDVTKVQKGDECGIGLEGKVDFQEEDEIVAIAG